jgi:signal transduction histidine kinase
MFDFLPIAQSAPVIVAAGAVVLALAALVWAEREVRAARRRSEDAESQAFEHTLTRDKALSILAAEPGAVFVWPGDDAHTDAPRLLGRVAGLFDPEAPTTFEGLLAGVKAPDAERLSAAISGLRSQGAAFSLALTARDGRNLEATGRPVGGQAVLWLRDGAAERSEIGRLSSLLGEGESERAGLAELLDSLPLPLWRRDESLDLVWVNRAYAQAVDCPSAEAVVEKQIELDTMSRQLAQRARRLGAEEHETRSLVLAGERRVVDVAEVTLRDGSFGYVLDRTPLAEARQELEQHQAASRQTLDHMSTAVAIFGPDKSLRFYNRACTELWQLDRDWLSTGPKHGEILEALREARLLPEQANFPAWKRKRLALYNKVVDQPEELWHLPDGRTLRVITQNHPMGGLICLYEDISEHLKLESSHKLLIGVQRATLDHLYEGVALFGSDGRLKLFNPAFTQIWSLDTERLQGEPHFVTIASWCRGLLVDTNAWEPLAARVTSLDSERRAMTGRFERIDGAVTDFAVTPLPDGATLLTFLDVTDTTRIERALRERNDALEAADRMKSDFVSHVSYQLRTPLNTIIGFSTMLDKAMLSEPLTEKQHDYVGSVLEAGNQLLRLIDDILDLATIDAGRLTLDLSEVDIARALEAAVGLAVKRAQEAKLALELIVEPAAGRIVADERRIKQIVFNLISNAIAFTPPGGHITIGAVRSGEDVAIYVRDTGHGIAPRVQPTVFDRFQSRGSEGRRGAGLGLSLVKSLVELHGGWVELQSKPGEGTTVTCHLPDRARPVALKREAAA